MRLSSLFWLIIIILLAIGCIQNLYDKYASSRVQKKLFRIVDTEQSIAKFAELSYQLVRFSRKTSQDKITCSVYVKVDQLETVDPRCTVNFYFTSPDGGIKSLIPAFLYAQDLGWNVSDCSLTAEATNLRMYSYWQGVPLDPLVVKAFKKGCPSATVVSGGERTDIEASFVTFKIHI